MMRIALPIALLIGLTNVAHAQSEKKAAAEAAFRQGRALMAEGKTAEACQQFQRSQGLDPQLGTQYNLALCFEKEGRLASAWAEFTELGAVDTNLRRKADSARRARALEPRLTRMLIKVAARPAGFTLTRDGKDMTAFVDLATPVDPGEYEFEAGAPGHRAWRLRVPLSKPGATIAVNVPALSATATEPPVTEPVEPAVAEPETPDPSPVTTPVDAPVPAQRDRSRFGRRHLLAAVVTGTGVVITGIGIAYGLRAWVLRGDAEEECGGDLEECYGDLEAAQALVDEGRDKATASNILTGLGLVAITGGVVLYLTAPSRKRAEASVEVRPLLGPSSAGVAIGGRF